jgi:hypothetical protein
MGEASKLTDYFYPPSKTVCTAVFSRFLADYKENIDSFFFVTQIVSRADETRIVASKALLPLARDDGEREKYEKSINNKTLVLDQFRKYSKIQSQNLTNGAVNAFQRFFSGLIQTVALKRPETISSSAQLKIEDVLRFSSHRKLVEFLVDRKVNELAYGGLKDMERYLIERLGVAMFENEAERSMLKLFVEVRNINVHNGGIVNAIFASRVGAIDGFNYQVGKRFHVDFDDLIRMSENAMRVAMRLDREIAAKFRMQTKAHSIWAAKKKIQK